jgi:hypothetical protein
VHACVCVRGGVECSPPSLPLLEGNILQLNTRHRHWPCRPRLDTGVVQGLWVCVQRAVAKSASWLCLVVYLAAIVDPSGQCIHDQTAGTLVIKQGRGDVVFCRCRCAKPLPAARCIS